METVKNSPPLYSLLYSPYKKTCSNNLLLSQIMTSVGYKVSVLVFVRKLLGSLINGKDSSD